MTEVTITVYGAAAPQGSKRAFIGKSGRPHVIESSHDRVKSWRGAVVDAALGAVAAPLTGPLEVTMVFYLKRPKSHYRTGRNAHLLRDSAPAWPVSPPDTSKLLRATEDALSDAGLWADDSLVVRYAELAKCYADHRQPGADIIVRTLAATEATPPTTGEGR